MVFTQHFIDLDLIVGTMFSFLWHCGESEWNTTKDDTNETKAIVSIGKKWWRIVLSSNAQNRRAIEWHWEMMKASCRAVKQCWRKTKRQTSKTKSTWVPTYLVMNARKLKAERFEWMRLRNEWTNCRRYRNRIDWRVVGLGFAKRSAGVPLIGRRSAVT